MSKQNAIDFRQQIKQRMIELNINSGYALNKYIDHKITTAAIDKYLAGKSEMTAVNLELILNRLNGRLSFINSHKVK